MKSSIKKNYFYNASYQIFALLVPLVTTPYISRVLGAEGIGTYSYTYSMLRYFWLLSVLGAATFGARSIGINQEDKEKRSYCFWNLFSLKIILSITFIGLYLLYVSFIAESKLIALIQGINLIAVLFDITWFFQGMEDFKKVTIKNFLIKILNIIYIFVFIKDRDDLFLYVFGLAFFLLLGNLSLWISLPKYISKISIRKLSPFSYFKPVLQLFIPSVAVQIFSVVDRSMIGWFTGSASENGYYEQALKIVDMSLVLITTMGSIMIPKISREYNKGNKKEVKEYITKSLKFTFFISIPMTLGLISISELFVPIFFGKEYMKSSNILDILSFLFIFMGINSVTGSQYLISTGQQNKHTKFLLIGGGVNVVLNIILIPKLMAIGAAIASVIGEMIISLLELFYLNKTKQYNSKVIVKNIYKYVISGVCMFLIVCILRNYIDTLLGIIVIVGIGALIYFSILMILKDELILNEIKKRMNKIKGVS